MSNNYKYQFKYVIVGDSGCGKSSLLLQFIEHRFSECHDMTIGVEFGTKIINVKSVSEMDNIHTEQVVPIKLQIWDTAGQEIFRSISRSYYRSAAAALLVYDTSCRDTFSKIESWLADLRQSCSKHLSIILVANKADIEAREVIKEEGENLAKKYGLDYIETSAKTGMNVEEVFRILAEKIICKINKGVISIESTNGVKINIDKSVNLSVKNNQNNFWSCWGYRSI